MKLLLLLTLVSCSSYVPQRHPFPVGSCYKREELGRVVDYREINGDIYYETSVTSTRLHRISCQTLPPKEYK
jgi:hypothetical protein